MSFWLVKYLMDNSQRTIDRSKNDHQIRQLKEKQIELETEIRRLKVQQQFDNDQSKPKTCYHQFHENLSGYEWYKRYGCRCK